MLRVQLKLTSTYVRGESMLNKKIVDPPPMSVLYNWDCPTKIIINNNVWSGDSTFRVKIKGKQSQLTTTRMSEGIHAK